MNAKQKAELIRLVSEDCLLGGAYIDDEGRTCAVGHLIAQVADVRAFVAKQSRSRNPYLRNKTRNKTGVTALARTVEIRAVKERYGLTTAQLRSIQIANDADNFFNSNTNSLVTIAARRQRVIQAIDSFKVEE